MSFDTITLANTGLPLILVGLAALLVPRLFVPRETRSHRRLAGGITMSAGLLLVLSGVLLALFDDRDFSAGAAIAGTFGLMLYYLQSALGFALLWLPILALVWFGMAQRVERLRSEDGMREGGA
ncbi:hypothetical protein [Thalassococcus sp. S3]|uniref:hypothetical protein n=1 Tax=Thalassococcus sp. S3 TaxID=2017482 RepID=UPI00102459E8|nr:hypothetical protein [Thalassococcus sp. S3]QBF33165.1 hypothetical protein CFI11_18320 [Thalassococcus sp. S3]